MAKEVYADQIAEYFTKTLESTFLLKEITKKETREGRKQFYDILLQDSFGILRGTIWEELMEEGHETLKGKIVTVKALVTKDEQGAFRLVIRRMEEAEDFLMADYINGLTEEESSRSSDEYAPFISL